jgi:arginine utilization protein RocB
MGQFGKLFESAKLRKETEEDAGSGQQWFERGPLDLEAGVVIPVRPPAKDQDEDE